jgi:major type 1 subunit fimbrin (pilin)
MQRVKSIFRSLKSGGYSGAGFLLLMLGLCGCASASTCTGAAQTVVIPMPVSLNLPNNAAVGTILTNVVTTPATNFYTCNATSTGGPGPIGVGFETVGLTKATGQFGVPLVVQVNGMQLTVYNTNTPGVGIAIGIRPILGGCPALSTFLDLGTFNAVFPSPWLGQICATLGNPILDGAQIEAVLVKTGPISPGIVGGGVILQAASFNESSVGQVQVQPGPNAPGLISFSLSPTTAPVRACTTPNVTVSMGVSNKLSTFKGVGTTTPPVAFNLAITNCSPGVATIQYQFTAPSGVAIAAKGVLALTSASLARGIGLQVTDSSGVPLKFDGTVYSVSGVNGASTSYNVPLKAAYYQTGTPLVAGSANAVMTFTMTYQ